MKYSKSITGGILMALTSISFAQGPLPYPPVYNPNVQNYYWQNPYQQNQALQNRTLQNPYAMPGTMQPAMPAQTVAKNPFREFSGYLGIAVDLLPASLIAQLPTGATQGVLVKEFANDSPASRDLQVFDVIVKYGDTPLKHPAQFIKLVRENEPNEKVLLKVVRKGEVLDVTVSIGAQKTPDPKDFNGLAIKQLGKNKYEALIRFVGNNGNKQRRSYRGTREEIFEQAINAQDLPQAEREQLLYATRPRQGSSNNGGFGSFFPFGGKNESGKDWMNPSRFFKW